MKKIIGIFIIILLIGMAIAPITISENQYGIKKINLEEKNSLNDIIFDICCSETPRQVISDFNCN